MDAVAPCEHLPKERFYIARATQRHAQWGDFDRDGVVNQFDRAPRNPRRY